MGNSLVEARSRGRRIIALSRALISQLSARAPQRVQVVARGFLQQMARRWPLLARLLGARAKVPEPESTTNHPHEAKSTEALIAELRDPSAEVAVKAAEALMAHSRELAVPALRDVVENRDRYFDASTRAAAVHALKSLLPPGQGGLVAAAARDSDASVSIAAIAALVERDDTDSANVLLTLLEDSTGFYIGLTRQAAARGLARLRGSDPGRIAALLQKESDPEVRQALAAC
jgi:HEAT repeat protein